MNYELSYLYREGADPFIYYQTSSEFKSSEKLGRP